MARGKGKSKPRKGKKRSRSKAIKRISKYAICKALAGIRKYKATRRADVIQPTVNRILWKALHSHGHRANLQTILTQAGQDNSVFLPSDIPAGKVRVFRHKVSVHFRNISNHPVFFTVYVIGLKENHQTTKTSSVSILIDDLVAGWDVLMAAGQVTTADTGTEVEYKADNEYCTVKSPALGLKDSKTFQDRYYVVKKTTRKLSPGDDLWLKYGIPCVDYNHDQIQNAYAGSAQENIQQTTYLRKSQRICLVRCHGAMGKSDADDTVIGYMDGDIAYEMFETAQMYRLQEYDHTVAMADTVIDDLSGVNLVGPSEHDVMAEDDQAP